MSDWLNIKNEISKYTLKFGNYKIKYNNTENILKNKNKYKSKNLLRNINKSLINNSNI